jgi:hypothetical protein
MVSRVGVLGRVMITSCLIACDGARPTDAGSDAPPGADTADAPPSRVRMLPLTVNRTLGAGLTGPAAGAVVALDQPGTARREEIADDQGRVMFLVDWSLGPVDVTAYRERHGLSSRVGWTEDDFDEALVAGRPVMVIDSWENYGIEITGTVANKVGTETRVSITPTTPDPGSFDDVGPAYSLYTWPRADFGLVAFEYEYTVFDASVVRQTVHRWAVTPRHTPVGVDEVIDIDLLAQAVTPTVHAASFAVPADPFFEDPSRYIFVDETDPTGGQLLGVATSIDVGLDGAATYTMEAIEVPGVPTRFTRYYISTDTGYSMVYLAGGGRTGPQDVPWLSPPSYAEAGVVPRAGEIAIDGVVAGARTAMWVFDDAGTTWNISGQLGGTSMHLPALPTGASEDVYLPSGARVGLYACGARDPVTGVCRMSAGGEDRPLGS